MIIGSTALCWRRTREGVGRQMELWLTTLGLLPTQNQEDNHE